MQPDKAANSPEIKAKSSSSACVHATCRTVDFPARVGILTRVRQGAVAAASLLLASGAAADWQPIGDIATAAERYLGQHLGSQAAGAELVAGRLDPRLQLPACSETLTGFLQRGARVSRRMTVGVRCQGDHPWKVYVPVDVVVSEPVVVIARSLPSGHRLTAADLAIADRDVASLTGGYLSATTAAIGRELKQPAVKGRVLSPRMMKREVVIKRGQSVTLTVSSDALDIRMEGKALMDGSVNQRIRVENVGSKRVIEGVVRSPEHVEILVF